MNQEAIRDKLIAGCGENAVRASAMFRDQINIEVPKEKLKDVCLYLRDDPDLAFGFLSFVCGVDHYPESPRFALVYQLYSVKHQHRVRISTLVNEPSEGLPEVDSVTDVWPTADWHERETAEMFGIKFNGHPDPRKLLLPEEWTVYPLRKDFPVEGTDRDTPDLPETPKSGGTRE